MSASKKSVNGFTVTEGARGVWVSGMYTRELRSSFKAAGGVWNKVKMAWYIKNDQQEVVMAQLKAFEPGLKITEKGSTILVTGNTYPRRKQLRELGGTWQSKHQGWSFPAVMLEEVQALS